MTKKNQVKKANAAKAPTTTSKATTNPVQPKETAKEQPKPAATPKPETTTTKPNRDNIMALAKKFNHVLGTTIPVKANVATEFVTAQIQNNADKLVTSDFTDGGDGKCFNEGDAAIMVALGVKLPTAKKPAKTAKTEEEKAAEKAAKQAERDAKKAAKKAEKAAARADVFTWTDATEQSIRKVCVKGANLKEITEGAIAIYKEHNADHDNVPKNVFRYMVAALLRFAVLAEKEGKYVLAK